MTTPGERIRTDRHPQAWGLGVAYHRKRPAHRLRWLQVTVFAWTIWIQL